VGCNCGEVGGSCCKARDIIIGSDDCLDEIFKGNNNLNIASGTILQPSSLLTVANVRVHCICSSDPDWQTASCRWMIHDHCCLTGPCIVWYAYIKYFPGSSQGSGFQTQLLVHQYSEYNIRPLFWFGPTLFFSAAGHVHAALIDWHRLRSRFGKVCSTTAPHPSAIISFSAPICLCCCYLVPNR
jgi:hypothetical protein